jgi:hypothetical protein
MALIVRPKIRGVRLVTAVVILAVVAALAAATVVAAVYLPQIAIWVPILTLGLALALQKYTASFLAYSVVTFSDIYGIGDRIRINSVKGDVRRVGLLHSHCVCTMPIATLALSQPEISLVFYEVFPGYTGGSAIEPETSLLLADRSVRTFWPRLAKKNLAPCCV